MPRHIAHHHHHHDKGNGKCRPSGVLPESALSVFAVNRQGWEAIRQDLYDSQTYLAAGQPQLNFFVTAPGGRTLSASNMELAGQMPSMQKFLVESVEIDFQPNLAATAAFFPFFFGAEPAANINIINDVWVFRKTGFLEFDIGSKYYLQSGPMKKFPSKAHFEITGMFSDATTAAAAQSTRANFADIIGRPWHMTPYSVLLESNQNFKVSLNWPEGNQALPSAQTANVIVTLDGLLYRRSQ